MPDSALGCSDTSKLDILDGTPLGKAAVDLGTSANTRPLNTAAETSVLCSTCWADAPVEPETLDGDRLRTGRYADAEPVEAEMFDADRAGAGR